MNPHASTESQLVDGKRQEDCLRHRGAQVERGTPLISGEERTREVFGDYVSIYDFQQSVEDGATVPLFYENRTPSSSWSTPTWTTTSSA